MPDTWEYPWFASWDLAFHCVALAQVDADFAKRQLLLLLREWYQHPNGQLPAYEWAFGDANPPVHAWAAFQVFRIDGQRDYGFLKRVFHKLLINFTWWVNRKDEADNNVFEGGFLGLDNIGPIDRGAPLPPGQILEQSDGTAWMARYCLDLLEIAVHARDARPRLRGRRHEVLRALHLHRDCDERPGPLGRATTASTTTCSATPDGSIAAAAVPVDGRADPDDRGDGARGRGAPAACPTSRSA